MEIRYTTTRADVAALIRHNLRRSPRLQVMLLGLVLFPAVVGAFTTLLSNSPVTSASIVPGLIIGLVAATIMLLTLPLTAKHDERVLAIGPEGIATTIGQLSGEVPWSRIATFDVTRDYIFVTGKSAYSFAIPSRAFANEQQRDEFIEMVEGFRAAQ